MRWVFTAINYAGERVARAGRAAAAERWGARRHRGSLELNPTAAEAIRIACGVVDTDQPRVVAAPRRRVSDKVRAAASVGFRPELEQPARDGVGDRRA